MSEFTYSGRRPAVLRLADGVGGLLMRCGLPVAKLDEASLLATARRRTGLQDFGGDEFLTPMRLLLQDCKENENLGFVARLTARRAAVQSLENRLRIHQALREHPEILDVSVRRPLVVASLPRSGTTLLHNLLAMDPAGRAPRLWELRYPWPLPGDRAGEPDPRIEQIRRMARGFRRLLPEGASAHAVGATDPDECSYLLRNAFAAPYTSLTRLSKFAQWHTSHDMIAEYRFYRTQLQMLLWQRPAEWLVLKYPGHATHLEALIRVLPDARVVLTHRDPAKVVGSFCSLVAMIRRLTNRDLDPHLLGRNVLHGLATSARRMIAARDVLGDENFCDVRYDDLERDPPGTVERIYRRFGIPLTDDMRSRMEQWMAEHPRHRHGEHRYGLSQFGLDPESVRREFEAYIERWCGPLPPVRA